MTSIWYVAAGCVVSAVAVSVTFARGFAVEVLLGMAAPLAIAATTVVLVEHTYRRDPRQVTPVLAKVFVAKMMLVGVYVAVVLRGLSVAVVPFIVSFTAYFIGLYVFEFACLRRTFCLEAPR